MSSIFVVNSGKAPDQNSTTVAVVKAQDEDHALELTGFEQNLPEDWLDGPSISRQQDEIDAVTLAAYHRKYNNASCTVVGFDSANTQRIKARIQERTQRPFNHLVQ